MTKKRPKKRTRVIPVRRPAADVERLAAAILGLAHYLRQTEQTVAASHETVKPARKDELK